MIPTHDLWTVLKSTEDRSVNFVRSMTTGGSVETRYVRRTDDYFIAYLSSHTGCKHACRFCHLTSNRETWFEPVDFDMYMEQAALILDYYETVKAEQGAATSVKFSWMARGEALSNPTMIVEAYFVIGGLKLLAEEHGLEAQFNISTIMPKTFKGYLEDRFDKLPITFYYSIYSTDESFRKRWLPRAQPVELALKNFADWQKHSGREIVLHWPFIADQNDREADVHAICDAVERHGLRARINVVRYNPPNNRSKESPVKIINRNLLIIRERLSPQSRIIPRVGHDIAASCGMFIVD